MNKRDFLAGAGAGALAAVCAPTLAAGGPVRTPAAQRAPRLPPLEGRECRAGWQRYVGQAFGVGPATTLRLARVDDMAPAQPGLEQFRLVFDAPVHSPLAAGSHALRHASGQRLSLYLDGSVTGKWHAVFSLLT